MIKNLIFDWGGVLSVSHHSKAVERFKQLGIPNVDEYFVAGKNWGGIFGQVEDGTISPDEFLHEVSKLAGKQISFEQIAYAWWGFHSYLPEGLLPKLISWRQKGYRLYILTNNNPFMMSEIRSDKFTLDGKPFCSYFDKIFVSCDIGLCKPDKAIYQYVLENQKLRPEETIFADDRDINLTGAKEVGMHTYLVSDNEHWMDDFENYIIGK